MKDKKIIFMGTPDFSVPVLKKLIEKFTVVAVVTQPDKQVGRKQIMISSPIKLLALEKNISVLQPIKLRNEWEELITYKPDLIITCAYGQILPPEVINLPPLGCINVHASLLPKLRGGAPIHRAIMEGYESTGISIMYMDEKMDTGDIITQEKLLITNEDNAGTLHDKLSNLGADLLIKTLPDIINKTNKRTPQRHDEATYGYNIKREDEKINFNKTCKEIYNLIRGLYPWPLAFLTLDKKDVKILNCQYELKEFSEKNGTIIDLKKDAIGIKCGDGIIYITKIKPFGKKEMMVSDYLNGIDKNKLMGKVVD